MDDQAICTGVAQLSKVVFGLLDHHVDFKRQLGMRSDRLDYRRPKRDRRNEMTVHHVDVDAVRAALFCFRHLFAQTSEVCREYGRGNLYSSTSAQLPPPTVLALPG